jgi:hypothetical protein
MVVHDCSPSCSEAERRIESSKPVWATSWVPGQPWQLSETKPNQINKQTKGVQGAMDTWQVSVGSMTMTISHSSSSSITLNREAPQGPAEATAC